VEIVSDKSQKGLWSYVKRFSEDNVGISVLKTGGEMAISPEDKDELFSVSNDEDTSSFPDIQYNFEDIKPITVTQDANCWLT
jgi:hypothetical protein